MTEPVHILLRGRRQSAEDANACLRHHPAGRHPRRQRELSVPLLHIWHVAELELPPPVDRHDPLLRNRERDPAARCLALDSERAQLTERDQWLSRVTRIEACLDRYVVELRPTAHQRSTHQRRFHLSLEVEGDIPDHGRAVLACKERPPPLGEGEGMERRPLVGGIQRHRPEARLLVEVAPRSDKGGDVRNRVTEPKPGGGALQMDGLVEVPRPGRVECHEGDVGEIGLRQPRRLQGLLLGLRRIALGYPKLRPDRLQPGPHLLVGRDKPKTSLRHTHILWIEWGG